MRQMALGQVKACQLFTSHNARGQFVEHASGLPQTERCGSRVGLLPANRFYSRDGELNVH